MAARASKEYVLTSREEAVKAAEKTSFWVPSRSPTAETEELKKPEERARSPLSGRPLRLRDLLPVRFSVVDEERRGGAGGEAGRYCCAVTRKEITHQKVVLLKPSGQVMLEEAARRLAYPTMTCPITGRKFTMDDVLELHSGGTGFAAHDQVEVSKFAPALV